MSAEVKLTTRNALRVLRAGPFRRYIIGSAISVDRSVFHGSRMVGFSLSGILISVWGMASAFFANALSFIALIVAILSLPPRQRGTAEEEEKRASGIKEGFLYISKDKPS